LNAEAGSGKWSALAAASRRDAAARVPFRVGGRPVGSVARGHLAALRGWPGTLRVDDDGVDLIAAPGERDAALAPIHTALRAQGLIRSWRDELFPLFDPQTLQPLARIERAAARFWGTLTLGAHCTGWVAGADDRPARLWIAQRAFDKATDPGCFDNLVGGGVPAGQSPLQALWREGWEEAGLPLEVMQRATAGRVIRLHRDIPEGFQHEWLYSWDLMLDPAERPINQDGEVAGFDLLPVAQAAALAGGDTMTVDAALVTIDFLLRHQVLDDDSHRALEAGMAPLWIQPPR
jgi:8-oxo-dGTP pyrophosphatase MutT (NUDIX family)